MIITSRWNCIKIILKEVRRPVWWKLNQTRIGCHREEKVIYISGRFSASVGSLVCPSLFATQRNKHPRFFHPPEIMEETRKRKSSRLWPFCLLVSGSSDGTTTVVEWQIDCCSQCLVGLSWLGRARTRIVGREKMCGIVETHRALMERISAGLTSRRRRTNERSLSGRMNRFQHSNVDVLRIIIRRRRISK